MKPAPNGLHRPASQSIAFPDVCKTPSPGGPIPIPYANLVDAQAGNGNERAKVQQKVIIDAASRGSYRPASATQAAIGQEPGTRKSVVSARTNGRAHFMMYAMDVKAEGAPGVRMADMTTHNR